MSPRKARQVSIILAAIGGVLLLFGWALSDNPQTEMRAIIFSFSALAVLFVDLVLFLMYWRCPQCKSLLPRRGFAFFTTDHCHRCGSII